MLERHVDELIKPVLRAHKGRITNRAGDEFLAEFGSAVAAVEGGDRYPAGHGGAERAGRAVAAPAVPRRPQSLRGRRQGRRDIRRRRQRRRRARRRWRSPTRSASPKRWSSRCAGRSTSSSTAMGKLKLKNIADPIHLFRLDPAEPTSREPESAEASGSADMRSKPSIAVLPFLNLSGDADQSYFSDGITEDLITDLSRFRTISVIARNSSFVYRGGNVDVRQVANDLGVRFVVEGSVRKMHDSVRITVQLVNARDAAPRLGRPLRRAANRSLPHAGRDHPADHRPASCRSIEDREPGDRAAAADRDAAGIRLLSSRQGCALRGHRRGRERGRRGGTSRRRSRSTRSSPIPYCYLVRILNNVTMHYVAGPIIRAFP